jgi:fumarate hydratase class II
MDAMPLTIAQEFGGWSAATRQAAARLRAFLPELGQLALGGTAVGTGVNTRAGFGKAVAARLAALTGYPFQEADDHFWTQGTTDTAVAASGLVKAAAVSVLKIANDLRWMNSGPQAGLGDVILPALQPGSSIMPGKINPVIPEAVMMVCCRVVGNDVAVTQAAQLANFQLAVGLPVTVDALLESVTLLAQACRHLADKAIRDLKVNRARIDALVGRNPILVTALNPVIGYDRAAEIAKRAYAEDRLLVDVAREMTELGDEELARLLDPRDMTHPK